MQNRSKIEFESEILELKARKWTYSEMAVMHRNWRTKLRREFIDNNPGRLPWDYDEPVKEMEWKKFLEKNDTEEAKVQIN